MATTRQVAANQANARRSTGPRTAAGKRRARLNAVKHGLSTPSSSLPEFFEDVAELAKAIAGPARADPVIWAAAAAVAEAEFDVRRTRDARRRVTERLLSKGDDATEAAEIWHQLGALDRYEPRALSRRKAAISAFDRLGASAAHTRAVGEKH